MLSEKQRLERKYKIEYFVKLFLSSDKSINELAEETHTPSSTIQRYLNDFEYIQEIFGSDAKSKKSEIESKLAQNIIVGRKKGGIKSSENNEALKDSKGLFIGSKAKDKSKPTILTAIKIYKKFLYGTTANEIAMDLNISSSMVESILNDEELIKKCFPENTDTYPLAIKARLDYNYKIGEYGKNR